MENSQRSQRYIFSTCVALIFSIYLVWDLCIKNISGANERIPIDRLFSLDGNAESDVEVYIKGFHPEFNKSLGVISILAGTRYDKLNRCLQLLHKNILEVYPYSVMIFHESNFEISQLNKTIVDSIDIQFEPLIFTIPSFIDKEKVPEHAENCNMGSVGYRHMCRFQAIQVYTFRILRKYKYVLRLDDDSFILSPVKYDLFKFMEEKDLDYGYVLERFEGMDCMTGLELCVSKFIEEHNINRTMESVWPLRKVFYNNFEVSRLDFWLSKPYQTFIDIIDKAGGIYYYRWGDAPIKTMAVKLLLPKERIIRLRGIHYQHQDMISLKPRKF